MIHDPAGDARRKAEAKLKTLGEVIGGAIEDLLRTSDEHAQIRSEGCKTMLESLSQLKIDDKHINITHPGLIMAGCNALAAIVTGYIFDFGPKEITNENGETTATMTDQKEVEAARQFHDSLDDALVGLCKQITEMQIAAQGLKVKITKQGCTCPVCETKRAEKKEEK